MRVKVHRAFVVSTSSISHRCRSVTSRTACSTSRTMRRKVFSAWFLVKCRLLATYRVVCCVHQKAYVVRINYEWATLNFENASELAKMKTNSPDAGTRQNVDSTSSYERLELNPVILPPTCWLQAVSVVLHDVLEHRRFLSLDVVSARQTVPSARRLGFGALPTARQPLKLRRWITFAGICQWKYQAAVRRMAKAPQRDSWKNVGRRTQCCGSCVSIADETKSAGDNVLRYAQHQHTCHQQLVPLTGVMHVSQTYTLCTEGNR